jgi:hypothetical protein
MGSSSSKGHEDPLGAAGTITSAAVDTTVDTAVDTAAIEQTTPSDSKMGCSGSSHSQSRKRVLEVAENSDNEDMSAASPIYLSLGTAPRTSRKRPALQAAAVTVTPETCTPKMKRRGVSFGGVVRTIVAADGLEPLCQTAEDARPSDCGKYYPVSAKQRASGVELEKSPRRRLEEADEEAEAEEASEEPFCGCTDGCRSGSCPCHLNGVGCWWEGWGCSCAGSCRSGTVPHLFDETAVRKARRAMLRKTLIIASKQGERP